MTLFDQKKTKFQRGHHHGSNIVVESVVANLVVAMLLVPLEVSEPSKLILCFLQALRTALSNRLARVQGFLFKAAFLGQPSTFTRLIIENLFLCLVQSALFSTTKFITGTLSLQFRKILTDRIHADYFKVFLTSYMCFINFGRI